MWGCGKMLVLYELTENKKDEEYRFQGKTSTEIIKWLKKYEQKDVSRQNIHKAKKNGNTMLGKYFIYEMDLEGEEW